MQRFYLFCLCLCHVERSETKFEESQTLHMDNKKIITSLLNKHNLRFLDKLGMTKKQNSQSSSLHPTKKLFCGAPLFARNDNAPVILSAHHLQKFEKFLQLYKTTFLWCYVQIHLPKRQCLRAKADIEL